MKSSLLPRCGVLAAAGVLVVAVLVSTASAGVNAPQSGWYSGNPLLGPNAIEDIVCSDPTCYATGTFGTVLKSTTAGSSWSGVVTGSTANLMHARLGGGAAEHLVTGGGCTIFYSHDAAGSFGRLPFTANDTYCPQAAAAFSFPAFDVGYLALVANDVLSTADAGQSFTRRTAIPGGQVADLLCVSDKTCFAAAGATIQRTTDGAASWTQVWGGYQPVNGIIRAGATTYYAVGTNLTVLKSVDGGDTWAQLPVLGTPSADLTTIRCGSPTICLVATRQGKEILRTVDGGLTFLSIAPSTDPTYAVEFASATRAIAAGAAGSVEVSDDAGATWRPVGTRISGTFSTIEPASGSVAYAGGYNGLLARTGDGGKSWQAVGAPTAAAILGIAAPTASTVFLLAADQTIERSDNAGASYKLLGNADGSARAIAAPDVDHVLQFGSHGVSRSTDGGASFSPVADPDAKVGLSRVRQRGSTIAAFAARRLIASTDGGATWTRIRLGKRLFLTDASILTPKAGYVVSGGRLWRTANGGRTWSRVDSVGASTVFAVDFSDAKHGYAVVNRFAAVVAGFVLRTDDGGASWHPQLVSPFAVRQIASAGGTDYAFADDSVLYGTTTGGDIGVARSLTLSVKHRTLRKPGAVVVTGRLKPAHGGERVAVGMRGPKGWSGQIAVVAANGTFTTRWRVSGKSAFVAQVLGDATHAGAATKVLTVSVRGR